MIFDWQKSQWQTLMQQIQQNRLPHALLLQGPQGTGKLAFALALAERLLCTQIDQNNPESSACGSCDACHLFSAGTHPDVAFLQPEPPEKSKSARPVLSIRIQPIRDLIARLTTTSQKLGYRIAILQDADRMVTEAANALLKTLEEPGEQTLIILVSSRQHRLPITIRSRCQTIYFPSPEQELAKSWLAEQGITKPDQAERALAMSHGAPLLAAEYAEAHLEQSTTMAKALFEARNTQQIVACAEELADMPKEHALAWFLDWLTDLMRVHQGLPQSSLVHQAYFKQLSEKARQLNPKKCYRLHDETIKYIRTEGIALNPQLIWENLLLSWMTI